MKAVCTTFLATEEEQLTAKFENKHQSVPS